MAEIIPKRPQDAFRNLWKPLNSIKFRPTADTLYVHVPVARIEKTSEELSCLHFYT